MRSLLFGALCAVLASVGQGAEPLSVLMLGDGGHHQPATRAEILRPVMQSRGIRLTYTEDVAVLNPETLARYDALLVYANIDEISDRQAHALLDYVAGGGGFVPVHSASYSFRNQPQVVALIGGQFQRHGGEEFNTAVVAPDHPIMRGLEPFRTWDETYIHHLHNPENRTVLQTRREGTHDEPWTWVRTHGKGRVFYTAYGHDERTWLNPGFHALLERGIRWATGQDEVFDSNLRKATGLPPFEYVEAEVPIYGAGHARQNRMPKPLSPEASAKHLATPRGFVPQLFAAEPEIGKPLAMTWDECGRLWLAETVDYPNDLQPPGKGNDRIRICEDTDGDGRADKFTVFADGLSIPTSMMHTGRGLVVLQAPDTLLLTDTDGDDRADQRKVLFTGWGTVDTHAGPSNLRYGLDNWLYGMVGYSGFGGAVGGEKHQFGSGFFRFKPDGSKLEFLRSTSNNSWGAGFTEDGLLFGSTANGCPSVYLPIPNRYYEQVKGWSSSVLANTSYGHRFFPLTSAVRQVDWFGGFTAASGHALYTARTYPQVYWNRTAFVTEPTGHLVATFALSPRGTDFRTNNVWNLVASDDEWTAPIAAEVGPDGNVWMIDWYNYIVQHNPTPAGFETGKRGAYVTPLRDKTRGRIYRVVYAAEGENAAAAQTPEVTSDARALVKQLAHPNMLWRLHAQRQLVERGNTDVLPELVKLVEDPSVDAVGLNVAAIHGLWTLHGLGLMNEGHPTALGAAAGASAHSSAAVRRNAVAVLPETSATLATLVAAKSLTDGDAHVRMAALLKIAELPTDPAAAQVLLPALTDSVNLGDRWLPDALTSATARHATPVLLAVLAQPADKPFDSRALPILTRMAEHYARSGEPDALPQLLELLSNAPQPLLEAVTDGLVRGWHADVRPELTAGVEQALRRMMQRVTGATRARLAPVVSRWGSDVVQEYVDQMVTELHQRLEDRQLAEADRIAAATQLMELRSNDADTARRVLDELGPHTSPTLATGLLKVLSGSTAAETGPALVAAMPRLTPGVRPVVVNLLLARNEWAGALLSAMEQGSVSWSELSLDQKQALAAHPDRQLATRARQLLARGGDLPAADRQKVIEELSPLVLTGGDVQRGREVYKSQCARCHVHHGEGNRVGPDLSGMAVHSRQELLIPILDPSRSVEGNFRVYSVVTDDGRVFNGLLASETRTSIELIDAEAKRHTLLRENIEQLAASGKSLMPEGFEKQVTPAQLADLLAFLTQRGKYLPLDLRSVATACSTQGMFHSREADAERLIFRDWSPKTFAGVPFQLIDPGRSNAPNLIMLNGPHGTYPPQMPRSVSLPCNTSARAIHLLSGVSGWGFPLGERGSVSMIVRLHYADGKQEDHELKNGIHFADYIRVVDVPESQLAFKLRGQQLRYLAVYPARPEALELIELVKGPDGSAPLVMAVTVETRED